MSLHRGLENTDYSEISLALHKDSQEVTFTISD